MSNTEDQRPGGTPPSPYGQPGAGHAPPPAPPPGATPPPPGGGYGQPSAAPPPPYGAPAPQPPAYGQAPGYPQPPAFPQQPAYGGAPVPGYTPYGAAAPGAKPPRPDVTIGALLMILGSILVVVGAILPWIKIGGENFNGFDISSSDDGDSNSGGGYVFLAVVLVGFGITFLAAKRVLAVAIIGVVVAAFTVIAAFTDLSDANDLKDVVGAFGGDASLGAGIPVIILGSLVALGGSIAALAKRRR